ncbi:sulfatase-modifying factor enzyme 1 [Geodermatophilus normandii]|uniref:Sulfatase-modifying factor enzyme 1 n=1 Tax=Geodermatophilus normandii TaxID=1137989 RepID=A0A317QK19_9ACTN|nr:SUMF1/EgtB/PvdO family nonheme iron enzyme [Geodermatophilus normandii]PWW24068.1 sulfatase-modifying factor enzyme 1 [Geodermatophilus normandii]
MDTCAPEAMLPVPAGRVTLSDRRTRRPWTVDVDAFELAAVPVTAELYARVTRERPHPVGGRQPNAWGLHDALGGVWEWCWDRYDPEVYGSYRVLRGDGWFDEHWSCRASVRRRSHPTLRIDDVGFRLACSVPR